MKDAFYGQISQRVADSAIDLHAEEVITLGYTVIDSGYDAGQLERVRNEIDRVYTLQEQAFGRDRLMAINELDLCRFCLKYSNLFVSLVQHETVLAIVRKLLGDWVILNLQNAIINRPHEWHHQRSWHRDLPHQNFVSSQPLAINALWAIDDFSETSGGTMLLPYSHKMEVLPSDAYIANNSLAPNIPAGSIVVFDSMLYHKAGNNTGSFIRRAINHVYTRPILKQQYDIAALPESLYQGSRDLMRLLGVDSAVATDDVQWRENRLARLHDAKAASAP